MLTSANGKIAEIFSVMFRRDEAQTNIRETQMPPDLSAHDMEDHRDANAGDIEGNEHVAPMDFSDANNLHEFNSQDKDHDNNKDSYQKSSYMERYSMGEEGQDLPE